MDNKIIGYGLLVGAALYLFSSNQAQENYFDLADGRSVPESELPALGYVKYGGHWIHTSKLNAAATQLGATSGEVDITTPIGWDILQLVLTTGNALIPVVTNNIAQRKQDLIAQIEAKYLVAVSASYNPNFPYTLSQLGGFTVPKLESILSTGIGAIQRERNIFTHAQCADGDYSTSSGKGTCTDHGGVRRWLN